MTVLRKSTLRPDPSVRCPSSKIWSMALKTSGCAFSISSNSTTAIGLAAYRFGELAAFAVTDVARRGADQTRDVVFLAVLAHVDADQSAPFVEEPFRQFLGQQRLADARRADEEEDADRAVLVFESGARALDRERHLLHGGILSDDTAGEVVFESAQASQLARRDPFDRDARRRSDDLRDVFGADLRRMAFERPLPLGAALVQFRHAAPAPADVLRPPFRRRAGGPLRGVPRRSRPARPPFQRSVSGSRAVCRCIRDPASSSTSMALSGKKRSVI